MLYSIFERTVGGLRRLLQAIAADVVEPTVIAAPDTVFLDPPVFKGSAAMRTMEPHESEPFRPVAEQYELFTQQFDLCGCTLGLRILAERNRPPITAQHFPGRCAGSH